MKRSLHVILATNTNSHGNLKNVPNKLMTMSKTERKFQFKKPIRFRNQDCNAEILCTFFSTISRNMSQARNIYFIYCYYYAIIYLINFISIKLTTLLLVAQIKTAIKPTAPLEKHQTGRVLLDPPSWKTKKSFRKILTATVTVFIKTSLQLKRKSSSTPTLQKHC